MSHADSSNTSVWDYYRWASFPLLRSDLPSAVPPSVPVYAGFGVRDLVEAGDLEAIGVASLTFVHEVAKGQHHLQNLSQMLAANHLLGSIENG